MDLGDFESTSSFGAPLATLPATIKFIVVGNGSVGKSSMTARYCKGQFTNTYKKTIGVDFLEKSIELEGGDCVKLMVWDTAGQEEFDAITSSYYRGAGACIIVFSTTDRASFEAVDSWQRKVEEECGPIPMALVQNKCDLLSEAKMTPTEVEAAARRLGVKLYRSCVKENVNISEVFEHLAAVVILGPKDNSSLPQATTEAASQESSAAGDASSPPPPAGQAPSSAAPRKPDPPEEKPASRAPLSGVAAMNGSDAASAGQHQRGLAAAPSAATSVHNGGVANPVTAMQPTGMATDRIKLGASEQKRPRKKSAFSKC